LATRAAAAPFSRRAGYEVIVAARMRPAPATP
jgi:hypothetical protein